MRVSDARLCSFIQYRRMQVGMIRNTNSVSVIQFVCLRLPFRRCSWLVTRGVALRRCTVQCLAASNPSSVEGLLGGARRRRTRQFSLQTL